VPGLAPFSGEIEEEDKEKKPLNLTVEYTNGTLKKAQNF